MTKRFIAFDQYGSTIRLKTKYPRKELLEYFGRSHASKMYRDMKSGGSRHVGYVIAGHWLEVFNITPAWA